ncbi:transglutaminase family protein [Desertivirga brevis]|uniref:transglutaminase family protein n=1 Tax=Desertivirga brevis TaxID=2810310 RepID=UPI001A966F73|nr:transglutaminase family protein [Pedobacter sp. SYSU D00873]
MKFHIIHTTSYSYSNDVFLSPQTLRLKPTSHIHAVIKDYKLSCQPQPKSIHWLQDAFGNSLARIIFPGSLNSLTINISFNIEPKDFDPFDFYLEDYAMTFPFNYEPETRKALCAYFEIADSGPFLKLFLEGLNLKDISTVNFLVQTNKSVFQNIAYTEREEAGVQTCEDSLSGKTGSCRDVAWLLVQVFRHLNIAARFVSGYLLESGEGITDRISLHAWTEVFLPGAGWIGLDPTTGLFAGPGHIPLAVSSNPSDAAPISGRVSECKSTLSFSSTIERLQDY